MNGEQLHASIRNKWGCSYDLQLRRVKGKIYLQVMWKYLEQVSFPLSEAEYLANLDNISNYLHAWGVVEVVERYIAKTKERPRLGKAISIPLELGERSSEWILER